MKPKVLHRLKNGRDKGQIICFPYLGGYANSFLELANILDSGIEVWAFNPPGHGTCTLDALETMDEILDLYFSEIQLIMRPGAVLFGHSMGGIIVYFLAQRLIESKKNINTKLILSACSAPYDFKANNYSELSDDNLIKHLLSYEGIPNELIEEKSLLEYYLPVFRADFKILESSSNYDFNPLNIPVYFFWGEEDKIVPIDSVTKWMKYFKSKMEIIPVRNGTHMFIHERVDFVARQIEKIINQK